MNTCVRGCGGSYGPEGYCDNCGHKAPASTAGAAVSQAAGPVACAHGCGGTYGPEGYCDNCGKKAKPGAVPAAAPVGSSPTALRPATQGVGGPSVRTMPTRSGRTRSRSTRGRLGAGLLDMPRVPLRDPAVAVMKDPQVAESRRFCGKCEKPVGRGRDGQPGRPEGFCSHCRTPYSYAPRLWHGDVVANRYEILGCLAYGGLGWIYLARDRNVSDGVSERWVVLKGLIDTGDPDAIAAAISERRYLVDVDHPNIVKIHDFTEHPDPKTNTMLSYIVMEYVGGQSLRQRHRDHRGPYGQRAPLPLPQVLAYGVEILPALGYLHDRGLLFCDFKPDNVIHAEEQLKLIDLGGVRHVDDDTSAIYGTPGYQAPEIAEVGTSIASDLYTVGRSLAVMSFEFGGFTREHLHSLPTPAEVPLLAEQESYHRLLRRATHRDPDERFFSASEMREQLLGVLREVLSAADRTPRPAISTVFTPERRVFGTEAGTVAAADDAARPVDWAAVADALPTPQVDVTDQGAGFLATVVTGRPRELVEALQAAPVQSPEVVLRLVAAHIAAGDRNAATAELQEYAAANPHDWRVSWYSGIAALASGRPGDARQAFDAVYDGLPGEAAAKLALAAAAEWDGDDDAAARCYQRVWRTDRSYVSAAFGLARVLCRRGDWQAAATVLDEVPDTSSQYTAAQIAAVRARLGPGQQVTEADLADAAARIARLRLDVERHARLAVELFTVALGWHQASPRGGARGAKLLGRRLELRELRFGLEEAYRSLAKVSADRALRITLVDMANRVRPRTMV